MDLFRQGLALEGPRVIGLSLRVALPQFNEKTAHMEAHIQHIYNDIHEFKTAASHVESEIRSYGLCRDSQDPVPEMEWRTKRDMWASKKDVSHFNLGTALELMLKMILLRNKLPLGKILHKFGPKERHYLAVLYRQIQQEAWRGTEETRFYI